MSIRQLTQRFWKSSLLRGRSTTLARFSSCWEKVQLVSLDICTNADYPKSGFRGSDNLERRIQVVSAVLDKIDNSRSSFEGDKVLKVCMMPEFLFRDQTGAYELTTILGRRNADKTFRNVDRNATGILDSKSMSLQYRLANLVKGSDWKNWFFVFGTVLGEKPITEEMIQKALVDKYTGAGDKIVSAMRALNNGITNASEDIQINKNKVEDIQKLAEILTKTKGESDGKEKVDEKKSFLDQELNKSYKKLLELLVKLRNNDGNYISTLNEIKKESSFQIIVNVRIASLLQDDAKIACDAADKALNVEAASKEIRKVASEMKELAEKVIEAAKKVAANDVNEETKRVSEQEMKVAVKRVKDAATKVKTEALIVVANEVIDTSQNVINTTQNVIGAAQEVIDTTLTVILSAKNVKAAAEKLKVATEKLKVAAQILADEKLAAEKVSMTQQKVATSDKLLQAAGNYIGNAHNIYFSSDKPCFQEIYRDDVKGGLNSSLNAFLKPAVRNAAQIFNVALLQEGGLGFPAEPAPFSPPGSFAIAKAAISDIDFLRYNNYGLNTSNAEASQEILTVENVQALPAGVIPTADAPNANAALMERANTPGTMRADIEMPGTNVFDKLYIDNDGVIRVGHNLPNEDKLVVGVEICLDHSSSKDDAGNTVYMYDENGKKMEDEKGNSIVVEGMLQKVKNRHRGQKDHDIHKVQLQLITSCGMSINPSSILTRDKTDPNPDTLVFLCDGMGTHKEDKESNEPNNVVRITRSQAIIWNEDKKGAYGSRNAIKENRSQINLQEKSQIEVDTFEKWRNIDAAEGGHGVFFNSYWHPFIRTYEPVTIPSLTKKA